jgi:hypothetical protein
MQYEKGYLWKWNLGVKSPRRGGHQGGERRSSQGGDPWVGD